MTYRPDIDGLRTLAVVPVVLFHANVAGISGGFVGVDVFFVISGYLITTILRDELADGDFSLLRFYERRARRILPALFVMMAVTLVGGWALLAPRDYADLAASVLAALLFLSNLWFWQSSGGYFAGPTDYLPMLHTWSLAIEEQFYILYPLVLMLLWRWRPRLVLPVLAVVVLASLALSVWATPRMPSAAFFLLPTRLWELGFGALLALGLLPAWKSRGLWRDALAATGLVAVLLPVVAFDRSTPFPGLAALLPVTGAALLIWTGGADGPTRVARLLAARPLVTVGLMSYSLYLWHWPLMALLRERLMTVHLDPVWQVVAVTVAFALGWASWRYVERPFRARITTSPAPRRVFAISAMGMAVVSVLAGAVWMTEGAKLRFSPQELAMLASLDVDPALRACRKHQHPDHLCSFGAPPETATGTWLLWGDSHAEAALPALDAWARDQNKTLRLATLPACAPLPGITRLDQPADRQAACRRFLRAIETHVLQDDRYERVWLHARWPLYIEGRRYGDDDSTTIILAAEGAELGANISADSNPALAKGALERLLIRFLARGVEVTVIGSLPEMPWDVAQQVQAQVLYGTAMPPGVHRDLVATRQQRTEAVLAQAARLAGAEWLPITAQICQPACPTHDARSIFYRDNHHLTRDGALNLLLPLLRAAMTGQASPQSRIAP